MDPIHDIRDTSENGPWLDEDLLAVASADGLLLVAHIDSRSLSGDQMYEAVHIYLEAHAQAIGSEKIAPARLSLYNRVSTLPHHELATQLQEFIEEARAESRLLIEVERGALGTWL